MAHVFSLDLLFDSDRHCSFSISKKLTSVKSYFQRSWKDVTFPPYFPFVDIFSVSHIIILSDQLAAYLSNSVARSIFPWLL